MSEKCSFCQKAIEEFKKNIEFANPENQRDALAEMILAYGKLFECGEDRLTCEPLKQVMEEI
jgi:hypothetical protein